MARPREGDSVDADEAGAAPVLLDARAPARGRAPPGGGGDDDDDDDDEKRRKK